LNRGQFTSVTSAINYGNDAKTVEFWAGFGDLTARKMRVSFYFIKFIERRDQFEYDAYCGV